MTVRAVFFDLWQTLAPLTQADKDAALAGTAAALGCHTAEFRTVWAQTRSHRETVPLEEYLLALRDRLGQRWTPEQMREARDARFRAHYRALDALRPGARSTLTALRRAGAVTGLVSNCSSDVRTMLARVGLLPLFDVVALSAEVGVMKPDVRIFRHAMGELGVDGGWYLGDGDDDELAGARAAGLTDVLLDLGEGRSGTHQITEVSHLVPIVLGEHP